MRRRHLHLATAARGLRPGRPRLHRPEWRPGVGYASGGAGYFLSRKAAAIVAERLASYPTGAEDLLVGRVLKDAGIELSIDPRFVPFGSPDAAPARTTT